MLCLFQMLAEQSTQDTCQDRFLDGHPVTWLLSISVMFKQLLTPKAKPNSPCPPPLGPHVLEPPFTEEPRKHHAQGWPGASACHSVVV